MRNLKKFLALVLAMMMAFSLMVTVNAATTTSTDPAVLYADALFALNGMKVLEGTGNGLEPAQPITRGQMAAIIYRIMTGDNDGNKDDVAAYNYGHYATDNFSDVTGHWARGYIGYCASGGIIEGYPDKTFNPEGKITGYEVLTMLLRALGYGKKGEFTGSEWTKWAFKYATENGLYANLKLSPENVANRGQVAQMTFNAAVNADRVVYTPGLDYLAFGAWTATVGDSRLISLGNSDDGTILSVTLDDWGIPEAEQKFTFTIPNKDGKYSVPMDPVAGPYTKAVAQCDIVADLDADKDVAVEDVYVNGVKYTGATAEQYFLGNNGGSAALKATAEAANVGGQGRWTAVYAYDSTGDGKDECHIVMLDQFLAKVDSVSDATYDKAPHLDKEATIVLKVYDAKQPAAGVTVTLTNGDENYPYSKGDYVLVCAKASTTVNDGAPANNVYADGNSNKQVEIIQQAVPTTATQTAFSATDRYSVIGSSNYNWAHQYRLNKPTAASDNNKTYDVYTDIYGNVIGLTTPAAVYSYGIITDIAWEYSTGSLADPYAVANLMFMNTNTALNKVMGYIDLNGDGNIVSGEYFRWDNGSAPGSIDGTLSANKGSNSVYWNTLYQYAVNSNGVYNITKIGFANNASVSFDPKEPNNIAYTNSGTKYASTNDYTVFLVKTLGEDGKPVYTPYTGYKTMPKMTVAASKVSFFVDDNARYITYMYVDATGATTSSSSKFIAYIADNTADYVDGGTSWYDIYVNGEVKRYADSASIMSGAGTADLYLVEVNASNAIIAVTRLDTEANATSAGLTIDTKDIVYYSANEANKVTDNGTSLVVTLTADSTEKAYNSTDTKYIKVNGSAAPTEVNYTEAMEVLGDGTVEFRIILDGTTNNVKAVTVYYGF